VPSTPSSAAWTSPDLASLCKRSVSWSSSLRSPIPTLVNRWYCTLDARYLDPCRFPLFSLQVILIQLVGYPQACQFVAKHSRGREELAFSVSGGRQQRLRARLSSTKNSLNVRRNSQRAREWHFASGLLLAWLRSPDAAFWQSPDPPSWLSGALVAASAPAVASAGPPARSPVGRCLCHECVHREPERWRPPSAFSRGNASASGDEPPRRAACRCPGCLSASASVVPLAVAEHALLEQKDPGQPGQPSNGDAADAEVSRMHAGATAAAASLLAFAKRRREMAGRTTGQCSLLRSPGQQSRSCVGRGTEDATEAASAPVAEDLLAKQLLTGAARVVHVLWTPLPAIPRHGPGPVLRIVVDVVMPPPPPLS